VEQLGGQAAAYLDLVPVEREVHARPSTRGPVPDRVRSELCDDLDRVVLGVALRLRELLAIGVVDEARDGRVRPGQRVELVVRANSRVEEPRADDLVRLRTQVHRVEAL